MSLLVSFQQLADNLGDQERRRQAEEEEEVYCLDWYGVVNVTFESGIHLQKCVKIYQNGYTIDLVVWNDLAHPGSEPSQILDMQHWQKERRRSVREERRAREERLRQESDDVLKVQTGSHAFKMNAMQRYTKRSFHLQKLKVPKTSED